MNEETKKRLESLESDLRVNRMIANTYLEAAAELGEKSNRIKSEIKKLKEKQTADDFKK